MSFDQELTPPFLLSRMPGGLSMWEIPTLAEAVDEFVRYGLPPSDVRGGCVVTDSDGVIAIGYAYEMHVDKTLLWAGTRSAVELLREHRLAEPLLIASIEMELESR